MAAIKKLSENQILSLTSRLNELNCPYTDGLDESAVQSLLFEPNEGRLQVLQWLFYSIDERLMDMVESKHGAALTPGLLQAASSLCLCSPDDIDLIQGKSSVQEQYDFVETLVDLSSGADTQHNVTGALRLDSSCMSAAGPPDQYDQDHNLLTSLAESGHVHGLLLPAQTVYPPDVKRLIDNQIRATYGNAKPPKPEVKGLIEAAKDITERYGRLLDIQDDLDRQAALPADDEPHAETLKQQVRVLLTELAQMQDSVTVLYDSHLRVWCHRQTTDFSRLGTTVHRLHATLQAVCKIFEKMSDLRRIYSALNQRSSGLSSTSISPVLADIECVGISGLGDVKAVIAVLDQAVTRSQAL